MRFSAQIHTIAVLLRGGAGSPRRISNTTVDVIVHSPASANSSSMPDPMDPTIVRHRVPPKRCICRGNALGNPGSRDPECETPPHVGNEFQGRARWPRSARVSRVMAPGKTDRVRFAMCCRISSHGCQSCRMTPPTSGCRRSCACRTLAARICPPVNARLLLRLFGTVC